MSRIWTLLDPFLDPFWTPFGAPSEVPPALARVFEREVPQRAPNDAVLGPPGGPKTPLNGLPGPLLDPELWPFSVLLDLPGAVLALGARIVPVLRAWARLEVEGGSRSRPERVPRRVPAPDASAKVPGEPSPGAASLTSALQASKREATVGAERCRYRGSRSLCNPA